ncbi:DUF4249 domain-containing protein [Weeksellaceae bacterium TAE3-ERU29]|nr:DUF4249 domain-containing protein [Weeksellaceae bacterium TAE3-ERU29]
MKNIITTFIIIFSFLFFVSCDEDFFKKEIDPPHLATTPQCVVQSYLSPDNEELSVSLHWSNPIFKTETEILENKVIKNASVKLFNSSGKSVQLFLDDSRQKYVADKQDFTINEKENYKLEVEIPNTQKVTANCEIPKKIQSEIQNIRVLETSDGGGNAYQVIFEFDDIPNEKNYYLAKIEAQGGFGNNTLKVQPFTDFNQDGKKILVRSQKIPGNIYSHSRIKVDLFSVDKSFYDYKRTVLQQEESVDLGSFAEPVFIISNINNGLGVFGGYTKTSKTKEL